MPIANGVIPSLSDHAAAYQSGSPVHLAANSGELPASFPLSLWTQQQERYKHYRDWYDGTILAEFTKQTTSTGEPVYKFPLQINAVRNFANKHAAIALGETTDTHHPLINPIVNAKAPLTYQGEAEPSDENKNLARLATSMLREIWVSSGGRATQQEAMTHAQFLGGGVLKATWRPDRIDLRIPIVIEKVVPDYFLAIWNPSDYLDLQEVFEVYTIPGSVAREVYGIETEQRYVLYYEHWTKKTQTIKVAGQPVSFRFPNGKVVTYDNHPHPWGKIPYVYLPAIRDGDTFWGRSIVPQIEGLVTEYNARMADAGDGVRDTIHRKRYMRNVHQEVKQKVLGPGLTVHNLGIEAPTAKHAPEVYAEDPPSVSSGFMDFITKDLWNQLLREGELSNIAFGEDEGSQRSALTMAFRMLPTVNRARQTRTHWEDGLNWFNRLILEMCFVKQKDLQINLPQNFLRELQVNQDWHPMIPRDREQEINEVILLKQARLLSPKRALERLGDVRDVEGELELIYNNAEFEASLNVPTEEANVQTPEPASDNASEE